MRFFILLLMILGLAIYAFQQMPSNEMIVIGEKISTQELSIATINAPPLPIDKPKPPKKKQRLSARPKLALEKISRKPTYKKITPQRNMSKASIITKKPEIIVEEMPYFRGCQSSGSTDERRSCADYKLLKYLRQNIKYPKAARLQHMEGIVYVQFMVKEDGEITEATLIKDIGYGCGKEALRVVQSMPKWEPGRRNGRAVPVRFNLPVRFQIN